MLSGLVLEQDTLGHLLRLWWYLFLSQEGSFESMQVLMPEIILPDNISILGILYAPPQALRRKLQKPEMMSYLHGKKAFLQLYASGARWNNDFSPVSLGQVLIISN